MAKFKSHNYKYFLIQMGRKSLKSQKTPATPIKKHSIIYSPQTPSPNTQHSPIHFKFLNNDPPSPFTDNEIDSPLKSLPFDYSKPTDIKISSPEKNGNIDHVIINHQLFVVKSCCVSEMKLFKSLNHFTDISQLTNTNHNLIPTINHSQYILMPSCYPLDQLLLLYDSEIPNDLLIQWSRELINGIHYLHSNKIIHADIKPENCLIYDPNIPKSHNSQFNQIDNEVKHLNRLYICDLSISQSYPFTNTDYGDAKYYAPERIVKLDYKSDVFSYGLCVYEMMELIDIPQFGDQLYYELRHDVFKFTCELEILQKLVIGCCRRDENERMSSLNALELLQNEE
eukprot:NODE_859_length_3481_cov_0.720875.p2 type:complete len:340 gc:universal NODE_859_length_3481_cov_0.720875:2161-3180(+)